MGKADAEQHGFQEGDPVVVENAFGRLAGTLSIVEMASRTVQVHWPEGNVLVDPQARSPLSRIPAYKEAIATVRRVSPAHHHTNGVATPALAGDGAPLRP
jgi:formylmethanofuran dehydrogenase subunit D